jgi:hypothetical protein
MNLQSVIRQDAQDVFARITAVRKTTMTSLPRLVIHLLLFVCSAQAQFIQHWNWINGNPFWRRRIGNGYPNLEVLQPTYPVILEYNCAYLPSICLNARSWMFDAAISNWPTRGPRDVFTYDVQAASQATYPGTRGNYRNRQHRRNRVCPDNNAWRGTRGPCPEAGQPAVLPGPWSFNCVSITGLETVDSRTNYETQAIRLTPNDPNPQRSNRQYTCDEFPRKYHYNNSYPQLN